MTGAFRAIVWLRWRLLFNTIKSGRRRDALEQVSRIFAAVVPVLFLVLSLGTVVAVSVLGFLGGRAIATGLVEAAFLLLIVRLTLAVMFGLLFIITIAAPGQTTLSKYKRLLIMPIPRQTLHVTEVVANLADPWLGFVIPGLILFAVGLVVGGQSVAGVTAFVAAVAIMAVFATTAALISFLTGWLLRSRRRGEMFTLIFVLALSLLSIIPALVSRKLDEQNRGGRQGRRAMREATTVQDVDRALPAWSQVLPSELYGRAILASVERRPGDALIALGALGVEAVFLFACSSAVHRKLIESVESDTRRRRSLAPRSAPWRLPLAGPAVSAIAITEFRTAMRSVRGRLAVLLPGPLVAVLTLALRGVPDDREWLTAVGSQR